MLKNKILILVATVLSLSMFATPDPGTPGGGVGGDGFGSPETPIDMYNYLLLIVGVIIMFIVVYSKKVTKA